MATCKIYLLAFFTALVATNLIFAESFFDQVDVGDDADRETRSVDNGEEHQDRLFFSLFPITTACNFTTQPGNSCASCTQAIRCLSNNVGIVRNCRGFLPYCNLGRCTFLPSANCTSG